MPHERFQERLRRIKDTQEEIFVADDERQITRISKDKEGNIVIPPEILLALGLIVASDGSIKKVTDANGRILVSDLGGSPPELLQDTSTGTGVATINITAGIWDILVVSTSFKMAADVADRTAELNMPSIGLQGVAATDPGNFYLTPALTLSASQYGYIVYMPSGEDHLRTIDNGARGVTADQWPKSLTVNAGARFEAELTANEVAADLLGIDVIARRIDV